MQASIRNRLITKPIDLFFEMQHPPFEIADHRVIGCAMRQSPSNLLFENLLSPLKIENVIWLPHDLRIRA